MDFYRGIFKEIKEEKALNLKEVSFYEDEYSVLYDNLLCLATFDIDFYHSQAAMVGDSILELACGTGRVGIPLARMGYDVTGIDISEDMLAIYRKKLENEKRRIKSRVHLLQADITKVELEQKFDLIILPATTICLFDEGMLKIIFGFVREHLNEGGRFVFDVMNFNPDDYKRGYGDVHISKWTDEQGVHFCLFQEFLFSELQELVVDIYEETVAQEKTTRCIGYTRKHIVDKQKVTDMLEKNGFAVVKRTTCEDEAGMSIEFFVVGVK